MIEEMDLVEQMTEIDNKTVEEIETLEEIPIAVITTIIIIYGIKIVKDEVSTTTNKYTKTNQKQHQEHQNRQILLTNLQYHFIL